MATTPSASSGGNTPTNSQWSPGATSLQTALLDMQLDPGSNYIIVVRAEIQNTDGTVTVSDWASIPYVGSTLDSSGSNIVQYNKGVDLRMVGGSIFATNDTDPLPKNLGTINVNSVNPTGSGIIINQSGIASFAKGVPQFRLSAEDGTAHFAGTVSAGPNIQIGPSVGPSNKAGIYINADNYWYDDGTFFTTSENVNKIVTGAKATKPGQPTNLNATWQGTDLKITFNFDVSAKDLTGSTPYDNTHIQDFVVGFTLASGVTKFLKVVPDDAVAQAYLLTYTSNKGLFGIPQTSFEGITVVAEDIYGNQGAPAITSAKGAGGYQNNLPVPNVAISNSNNGYTVLFNNFPSLTTYPTFDSVYIEEFVTTSSVVPDSTAVYSQVSPNGSQLNPSIIITPNTLQRWVRARYKDIFGNLTAPSSPAVKTNPVNPVAAGLDLVPPNETTLGTVEWSTDDVSIHYSLPSTDPGVRFVISLTTNYAPYDSPAFTGFFYKYPDGSGIVKITKDELFQQFGAYYTSFTGVFKSADQADNRTSGVNFTVPAKVSYLNGTNTNINSIGIFAIPGGYVVLPPNTFPQGAAALEVWQATTSSGLYSLVASSNTLMALLLPDTSTYYIKVRYSGISGDYSNFTTPTAINALDAGSLSTPAPATPSFGLVSETSKSITLGIDAADTITKGYYVKYQKHGDSNTVKIDMVPASGIGTTNYTIPNLAPAINYDISVAAYNDANVLSSYTSVQQITTLTVTVPPPTNVILVGQSYAAIGTWTAPSSSDTPIGSYGVSLYTSAGTAIFTNQITNGVVYSFPGLKASTSYYIKVYSIDIFGNKSTVVQSNTININSSGGSSDNLVPNYSPVPIVNPLFGALQVTWDKITNVDLVTYEVHVSTSSGFTPSPSTKSIETEANFAVVKTLPLDSSQLVYGTTYYIKIVAKDYDGVNTGPYTQASGVISKVDNGDIAANAIRANSIQAGTITGDKMVTDSLFASQSINVGQSTSTNRIRLDATVIPQNTSGYTNPNAPIYGRMFIGTGLYSDANTAVYLDNLGRFSLKSALLFDGTNLTVNGNIVAQGGYFNQAVNINGLNGSMKLGRSVNPAATLDGLYINSNNYWYDTGKFNVGSSGLGISWDPATTTFKVTGEFHVAGNSTFDDVVQILTTSNGGLLVGDSKTTGPRVVINKNGIYAYDFGATSISTPTTSINLSGATGVPTFNTNNATIGGWTISAGYIESNFGASYYGISSTGTYALYAGSAKGGSSTAKFSVTQAGVLTAREIYIIGTGTAGTKLIDAGSFSVNQDGSMTASAATITGSVTASSGEFFGNVWINTAGSIYSTASKASIVLPGATGNPNTYPILGSAGYIINKNGITFYDGTTYNTTIAADGTITAVKANIGGWTVDSSTINKNGITLSSAISGSLSAITASSGAYYVGMTPPTSSSGTTDVVLWAGQNSYSQRGTANFRVQADGTLYASGAEISGKITISSGPTLTAINKAQTDATAAANAASDASTLAASKTTASAVANVLKDGTTTISGSNILTGTIDLSKATLYGTPSSGKYIQLDATNGIRVYDGSKYTVSISPSGTATFAGSLTGSSGTFGGATIGSTGISSTGFNVDTSGNVTIGVSGSDTAAKIFIGNRGTSNYFETGYTRTGTSITGVGVGAISIESATTGGVVSSWYPWVSGGTSSLGTINFPWYNLYVNNNAYFANGTTFKIDTNGNAYLNGYGISGGYGVTSDWSPRTPGGASLGQSGQKWSTVYAVTGQIQTSDRRQKTNINDSILGLEFINKLKPVSYKWIEGGVEEIMEEVEIIHEERNPGEEIVEIVKVPKIIGKDKNGKDIIETRSIPGKREHYGLIAQEVKEVLNELIPEKDFAGWTIDDTSDPESPQGLRYTEFIAPIIKAIQEMSLQINNLQTELDNLKK